MTHGSVQERDFSNFEFGDNPRHLASGLVDELAERVAAATESQVFHEDTFRTINYEALIGVLGCQKTLRDNPEPRHLWDIEEAASLVERSGIQRPQNRKLWTPNENSSPDAPLVLMGAVANWQDRAMRTVAAQPNTEVHIAVGARIMNSLTEVDHVGVQMVTNKKGSAPTETDYVREIVAPILASRDKHVTVHAYEEVDGDKIAGQFVRDKLSLFEEEICAVRAAGAGVQLALQLRAAVRSINIPEGMSPVEVIPPVLPQLSVITDSLPVAWTEEQLQLPADFQSPYTALRQVAVTAKLLHESREGL